MHKTSNNKYRFFASDLDGTLLTSDKVISPNTLQALNEFVARGGHFAICTGRDINSARSVYENLGLNLPGSYVIAYNGGQIYDVDAEKTIYRTGIAPDMVEDIFRLASEYRIHVHTYNDSHVLSPTDDEELAFYRRVIKTPVITGSNALTHMNVPPCKVIAIELHNHEKEELFHEAAEKAFGDTLSIMYSNNYYLELIPKESGKGNALIKLADCLNIPVSETMAAGDGENDISMIEAAGLGIAMINAPENVKSAANAVTRFDNNHDGLAEFLLG